MHSHETHIRIPFHDVDSMNIVWHGYYAKYFEVARCELLESFNYSYDEMFQSGYAWPIVDMRAKYILPLKFHQNIVVRSELSEWENRLKINYIIRDRDSNATHSKGHTTQMAICLKTNETLFESPDVLLERVLKMDKGGE